MRTWTLSAEEDSSEVPPSARGRRARSDAALRDSAAPDSTAPEAELPPLLVLAALLARLSLSLVVSLPASGRLAVPPDPLAAPPDRLAPPPSRLALGPPALGACVTFSVNGPSLPWPTWSARSP